MEKDRDYFEKEADIRGYDLSERADKVIKAINKKDGNCPCRLEKTVCPCPMLEDEVEDQGTCTCNLFIKKAK